MLKKKYKVIFSTEGKNSLRDVQGYFTHVDEERVFIYNNFNERRWFVVEPTTGMSFASGRNMYDAKFDAHIQLPKLKEFKKKDDYFKLKKLYANLVELEAESTS